MMCKETFVKLMNHCCKLNEMLNKLDEIIEIGADNKLYSMLDNLINIICDDVERDLQNTEIWNKYNFDDHCYLYEWLYDYSCGTNYDGNYLVEINNIKYKPENAGELYEVYKLLNNMVEKDYEIYR